MITKARVSSKPISRPLRKSRSPSLASSLGSSKDSIAPLKSALRSCVLLPTTRVHFEHPNRTIAELRLYECDSFIPWIHDRKHNNVPHTRGDVSRTTVNGTLFQIREDCDYEETIFVGTYGPNGDIQDVHYRRCPYCVQNASVGWQHTIDDDFEPMLHFFEGETYQELVKKEEAKLRCEDHEVEEDE